MSTRAWCRCLASFTMTVGFVIPCTASAQWEAGLGLGVANTHQNAVALVGTLARNGPTLASVRFALRGFADAELAVPDFKAGLGYSADRQNVVDGGNDPQRPEGNTLWQARGWDTHAALYATVGWWRVHAGGGYAYNGLDGTWGPAVVVAVYVTARTEVDVEFLDPPGSSATDRRWRLRLSIGFWSPP